MPHAESPILTLPIHDATRIAQLRAKLAEYELRLNPYAAPETQMGTVCKTTVLQRLLRDGRVVTWDLCRELRATFGTGFSPDAFINACRVIEDYCQTGGQTNRGGTGLPAPDGTPAVQGVAPSRASVPCLRVEAEPHACGEGRAIR